MAIDKKRLVVNEKGTTGIDVGSTQRPSYFYFYYYRTKLVLLHIGTVLSVVAVLVTAALLCTLAFKKGVINAEKVESNGQQKYLIRFGSMTEHVIDDPSTRMTQYHVTGPDDDEIWVVDDYGEGLRVIKVADAAAAAAGGATCYVTSLDDVRERDFGPPLIDMADKFQTDDEVLVNSDIEESIMSFVADHKPISDTTVGLLGPAGRALCAQHPTYPMWRLNSGDAFVSEPDADRASIRTYVIEHRKTPSDSSPRGPLSPFDAIVPRVRRHEQRLSENEAAHETVVSSSSSSSSSSTSSSTSYPVAESSTKVFRLWDYFGRRRTRTRRHSVAQQPAAVERPERRDEVVKETESMASSYRVRDRFTRRRQRRSSNSRYDQQQQQPGNVLPSANPNPTSTPPPEGLHFGFRIRDHFTRPRQRRSDRSGRQFQQPEQEKEAGQRHRNAGDGGGAENRGGGFRILGRFGRPRA